LIFNYRSHQNVGGNWNFLTINLARGLRKGPMRPANIRKKEILKEILGQFVYLRKNIAYKFNKNFFIFNTARQTLRPARQFEFETPDLVGCQP